MYGKWMWFGGKKVERERGVSSKESKYFWEFLLRIFY